MSAKKPTRTEALKALGFMPSIEVSNMPDDRSMVKAMDRLAALFGGFAPEPVEVPRLRVIAPGPGGSSSGSAYSRLASAATNVTDVMGLAVYEAAAARSNAWPGVLVGVRKAINFLDGDPLQPGIGPPSVDAARATLQSIANEMSAPEMGRGPGGGE